MKSFKKLLSVLVVLAMLASFVPASIAASYIYEDQAIILNNLDLFKGVSTTSFEPDLGGEVTREQGVIQLVRTLGKEDAAVAMTDADADKILIVFSDASTISSWSKKYIAWAVNNKVVAGYPNGKFLPQGPLDGKAYAKMILSALGHTVDAAGYEAACFLMRDKGVIQWGTRGAHYYVISFSEAQKFNEKELKRDDLVALSYAALKLPYASNFATAAYRNKTAIQVLIDNNIVTRDDAIAAYLYFKELYAAADAAVNAYKNAPTATLANIADAEKLQGPANATIADYEKAGIDALASIVNFNVKYNLNNAWIKADYDAFKKSIADKKTAIQNVKDVETANQEAANTALAAYEGKSLKTLAEIAIAEQAGKDATTAINKCQDNTYKTDKIDLKNAMDAKVAAAKKALLDQVAAAEAALTAYKNAPLTTPAEIDAALVLYGAADTKIKAVADPVKNKELADALAAVELAAGVKVSNTKTIEVNFNKPLTDAQKTDATFAVKFYSNALAMKNATWSGNKASLARLDDQALVAGNYTVEIGVGTASISKALVIEVEKPASISILSTRFTNKAGYQNVLYEVYNQYGQKMTGHTPTLSVFNLTDSSRMAVNPVSGTTVDFSACSINDVVKITAYLTNYPAVQTAADITVVNIFTQSVSLSDPTHKTAKRLYAGTSDVTITATMTSNFGESIKSFEGLVVSGTNIDGAITKDDNKGTLTFKLGVVGPATITVINPMTGAVVTKVFEVVANPVVSSIELTPPATNIRANDADIKLTYKMYDQYGDIITNDASKISLGSSNPGVAVLKNPAATNDIYIDPANAGNVTLTATVIATGKSSSFTVTILDEGVPVYIEVSGTPTVELPVLVAKNDLKIVIRNQDGKPIDISGTGYTLDVVASGNVTTTTTGFTSATNGITAAINATATAAKGTGTITVTLKNGATQIGSPVVVNYTVVDAAFTKATMTASGYIDTTSASLVKTLTYTAKDQADRDFTVKADTEVVWTIKNGTDKAIIAGTSTIGKGETKTVKTKILNTQSASTLDITADASSDGKIEVTAVASAKSASTNLYATKLSSGTGKTYTGTVVAFDKPGDWAVIETSIGYVFVDYTVITDFVIDGNSGDIGIFEAKISVGDGLATNGLALTLTNK